MTSVSGAYVAVKLLPASAVGNENARTRLIREARAAATLEHDGIIRVYDVGEIDAGGAYLVMELVRGTTLREALAKGALGFGGVLRAIVSAARALAAAHDAGIVHRDVKPDNIMLRDDGRVIVVDFGVAKPVAASLVATATETIAGVTDASLTAAGQLVGTPAYLAPEQARGALVSAATDQFALAVTAYDSLTGKLPWTGNGVVEIVASLLRDHPLPVTDHVPLPPAIDDVIARALEKNPDDRFPSMNAFADALEEIANELPADPSKRPSGHGRGAQSRAAVSTPKGGAASPPRTPSELAAVAASIDERGSKSKGALAAGSTTTSPRDGTARSWTRSPLVYALGVAALAAVGYATMHSRMGDLVQARPAAPTVEAIACPAFVVTGMDATWLGGAASALACERVQIARGGGDDRTFVPAELSDTPRDWIQPIALDIYEDAGTRAAHLALGKERGARWLDGKVDRQLQGFMVEIVLREADGKELARGKGTGVELFEAVRDALQPSLVALGKPTTKELSTVKEWLDVESPEDLLDLYDVRAAILIEDLVSLREACAQVAKRKTLAPRVSYLARLQCARKLRTGKLADPPPPVDERTPGALVTTVLAQASEGGPPAVRERAMRLERAATSTSNMEGKARLLAAAAEVYNLVADPRAREVARMSIQTSPKAYDWRTSAWHRVAFSSEGDDALGRALAAWQPWEPISQTLQTNRGALAAPKDVARYIQHGYMLGQRGYYASSYGQLLLNEGKVEAARGIAELTKDDLLRVEILLGEAKFGEAMKVIPPLLASLPPTEEQAALAFRLTHHGVRASSVLGRSADFVDAVVARYVDAEPHAVVDGVVPFLSLVTSCSFAPKAVGRRCIDRLRKLRTDGRLPTIFNGVDRVLDGADRFVAEDYVGATKAWRQLLRAAGWIQEPLRDAMSVAFDKANEPELADEVDSSSLKTIDLPRTAELSWVRAARRAAKKGDHARARTFALAVIDKWRFADEDIPSIAEMKALVAKLPP